MKVLLLCFFVALCGAARVLPERPECAESPVEGNALCDILPPECRFPKCGRDYNYQKRMWFGNECYMNQYNKLCRTNFVKTSDAMCDRNERPPPILKPCSLPIKP